MKKVISILLCLAMLLSVAVVASAATDGSNVIINEVYGGGGNSGAPYTYDFVELYNPTDNDISLGGWSLQYASSTGSFSSSNVFNFPSGAVIKAHDYYLVQLSAGTSVTNKPLPGYDASGSINLSGTKGKIALVKSTSIISGPTSSNVVDFVGFGSANAYEGAATAAPSNSTSVTRTNFVDTDNNKNDFKTGAPSPQKSAEDNHTHNSNVTVNTDPSGHWTECTCGENKSTVTAHSLTNHVCTCGYVADPGTDIEAILKCLYALPSGGKIPTNKTLTGKVVEIDAEGWSSQYNNITVTIEVEGFDAYPVVCYRMKGATDVDASVVKVGDVITVTGSLMNYSGTREFNSGCTLDAYVVDDTTPDDTTPDDTTPDDTTPDDTTPDDTTPDDTTPDDTTVPGTDAPSTEKPAEPVFGIIDAPVAGTAYKFGMIQKNNDNKVYYLAGGMDGYYMATTTNADEAIEIFLEATEDGYHLYTVVDGTKTYINMVVSGEHVNGAYEAAASTVYTIKYGTVVAVVNGEEYWFGTRNDKNYTTMGPCKVSYEGFQAEFYGESVPETSDSFSAVVIALMAVSVVGAGYIISKKKAN